MADQSSQQRLSAVLVADVVGYTRLMEEDTEGTVSAWQSVRDGVINPVVSDHSGRIVKLTGDGFLAEFPTVHQAVRCGIAMQDGFAESSLEFRIGINLGDIIDDGQDIHGEGVNVAARIEALADPGGICISASVHEQVRNRIDVAYDDLGKKEVKNVSAPVRVYAIRLDGTPTVIHAPAASDAALPDKPSIAVLPFDNLSGDPEQEYFSDGITEDIITALSHIRQFFVVARNSSFSYKGQSPDIRKVSQELGVRYVLEGSVRKAGGRIRISAQLIDSETGNHLWAEKYDRDLEDIFAVQDEITQTVVGALGPELNLAEVSRAKMKSPENLDAWDFYQRGMAHIYKRPTPDTTKEANRNFERAIELDADFALPYAGMVQSMYRQIIQGWENTPESRDKIVRIGRKAVELDPNDSISHEALCGAYLVTRQLSKSIQEGEISCELNPNNFHGTLWTGTALIWSGKPALGIPYVELALKISPREPRTGQALSRLAEAHISLGDYHTAVELAKRAVASTQAGLWLEATLVAALALADAGANELEDARAALLDRMHNFSCTHFRDNFPATDPHFIEVYVEGLVKAGLPEA